MRRLLYLPAVSYILGIWIVPAVSLIAMSFRRRSVYGGFEKGWSTLAWSKVIDGDTIRVFLRTIELSLASTVLCLILAYFLVSLAIRLPQMIQYLIMTLFAIPAGVDTLVKVFGWSALVGPQGFTGRVFDWMEVGPATGFLPSVKLLAVFVLVYLPLAVLPVWVAVRQVEPMLLRAARDCGANSLLTFGWVVLPLSRRGATAAVLLVWVSTLTNFLIPDLVGGAKTYFLGNLIKQQFFAARDWPLGAALGVLALGLSFLGLALLLSVTKLQDAVMSDGGAYP